MKTLTILDKLNKPKKKRFIGLALFMLMINKDLAQLIYQDNNHFNVHNFKKCCLQDIIQALPNTYQLSRDQHLSATVWSLLFLSQRKENYMDLWILLLRQFLIRRMVHLKNKGNRYFNRLPHNCKMLSVLLTLEFKIRPSQ